MEVAQDLSNDRINNQHKITTLDIKDLYANLLVKNITSIIKFWLDKYNNQNTIIKQTLELIKLVPNQNYFQYNDKHYKLTHGIAVRSPL
jgi:ribonuclease HIII